VAFENATYSGVSVPASAALRLVLESRGAPDLTPAPWPETLAMVEKVQQLARHWDDELADSIFTSNVAEDEPYAERMARIARYVHHAGEVDWSAVPSDVMSNSPAHRIWWLPASRENLRFEILLAPTVPPLIQKLSVTVPIY
jgi:hypothetical protein